MMLPKRKFAIDVTEGYKPIEELSKFHTVDLLYLLGYMRKERRENYNLMTTLAKVQHMDPKFKAGNKEAYLLYKQTTDKVKEIESILAFRLGTIPKKVTQDLIDTFEKGFSQAMA